MRQLIIDKIEARKNGDLFIHLEGEVKEGMTAIVKDLKKKLTEDSFVEIFDENATNSYLPRFLRTTYLKAIKYDCALFFAIEELHVNDESLVYVNPSYLLISSENKKSFTFEGKVFEIKDLEKDKINLEILYAIKDLIERLSEDLPHKFRNL